MRIGAFDIASGPIIAAASLADAPADAPFTVPILALAPDAVLPANLALLSTAGALTPEDAVDLARRARALFGVDRIALEIAIDGFPDGCAVIEAARALIADGLTLVPQVLDDPIACETLVHLGCKALLVMPGPRIAAIRARCAVPLILDGPADGATAVDAVRIAR